MEFCTIYSLLHWASLPICPLTFFILSWHLFFSSRRADERALRVPKHAMSIFLMMIPLATAWFEDLPPVKELKKFDFGAKMTAEQKRKNIKSVVMRDGPRPNQSVLLGMMWTVSALVTLIKLFMDKSGENRAKVSREFSVRLDAESSKETKILREEDIAVCGVWNDSDQGARRNAMLWLILVGAPVILGPVLTSVLEFCFYVTKMCSRSKHPETPSVFRQWMMFIMISVAIFPSLAFHLWLTEAVRGKYLQLNYFESLILKYFVGNSDIFIVPCLIIFMDPVIGRGLKFICYSRKNIINNAVSSPSINV